MDRQIVYPGAIPQDTDLLLTNKNTMVALGYLMQALLGTGTLVDGLACTPTVPPGMTVNVAGGSIYSLQEIDATAYGTVAPDTTDQIVKQGIVIPTTNFSCPAPVTVGQSVVYLVQATYQDVDGGSTVLPYYNASNPSVAFSGPNNTGVSQNTVRQGVCHLSLKTGVAATTGTQVTPTADAGYVGLWAITVANGASTITSGNIVQLLTAPFINPKLPGIITTIQSGSAISATDTSGAANTLTIALNPPVNALTALMEVRVKVANTNTGATVINTNALGNVSVINPDGTALSAGQLVANGTYDFIYDGTHWQLTGISPTQVANIIGLKSLAPQGRLSLNSSAPVMNADAVAQTTLYYLPFIGPLVPVYNGSSFVELSIGAGINMPLDSNSGHTGYQQSGNLFDVFVFSNSGSPQLCTGPAWTNSTTRAAAISLLNGIWTNSGSTTIKVDATSFTGTLAANQGTYVGTMYASANGQCTMHFLPAAAAGGTANIMGLYNAYNRVRHVSICRDSSSWNYSTATWRSADGSNSNRITFVDGLQQSFPEAGYSARPNNASSFTAGVGINYDSTSATPDGVGAAIGLNSNTQLTARNPKPPLLGLHYAQAMEYTASGTASYSGPSTEVGNVQSQALTLALDM